MFFSGYLLRQAGFIQLRKDRPQALLVVAADVRVLTAQALELELKTSTQGEAPSPLPGADEIMHRAIFLGTYPGLTEEMLAYEIQVIHDYVKTKQA